MSADTKLPTIETPAFIPPELRVHAAVTQDLLLPESPDGAGLTPAHLCTRSSEVVVAEIEGEAVLLDLASGYYFSLNRPGTVIWEMLSGENNLGAIHRALCRRFQVDEVTAWENLTALVRHLCSEKLAKLEAQPCAVL